MAEEEGFIGKLIKKRPKSTDQKIIIELRAIGRTLKEMLEIQDAIWNERRPTHGE